jgi:hypothetical protein
MVQVLPFWIRPGMENPLKLYKTRNLGRIRQNLHLRLRRFGE